MPPSNNQDLNFMDMEDFRTASPSHLSPEWSDSSGDESDSTVTEAIEYFCQELDDPEYNDMESDAVDSEVDEDQERPLKRNRSNTDSEEDDEQPEIKRFKRHISSNENSDSETDDELLPGTSSMSTSGRQYRDSETPDSTAKYFQTPTLFRGDLKQSGQLSVENHRSSTVAIIIPLIPKHEYFEFTDSDSDDQKPNIHSDGVVQPRIRGQRINEKTEASVRNSLFTLSVLSDFYRPVKSSLKRKRPIPIPADLNECVIDNMSDSTDDDSLRLVIDGLETESDRPNPSDIRE